MYFCDILSQVWPVYVMYDHFMSYIIKHISYVQQEWQVTLFQFKTAAAVVLLFSENPQLKIQPQVSQQSTAAAKPS